MPGCRCSLLEFRCALGRLCILDHYPAHVSHIALIHIQQLEYRVVGEKLLLLHLTRLHETAERRTPLRNVFEEPSGVSLSFYNESPQHTCIL